MTTKMWNEETQKQADVHDDEVENWRAHGWRIADGVSAKPAEKAVADVIEKVETETVSEEVTEDGDGYPDNSDLRTAIELATNEKPAGRCSRETLIKMYDEIPEEYKIG